METITYTPDKLYAFLKRVGYIWVRSPIRKCFLGKIVGWNINASSLLRKKYTLSRLQEEINYYGLPLVIKEENEYTNAFKVLINQND